MDPMNPKYLKEKIVEKLRRDPGCLDMTNFITPVNWSYARYDLTGLILLAAGYALQLDGYKPRLPLNAPHLYKTWMDYEALIGSCPSETREIPALARQVWADEYGDAEAMRLPFYDRHTIPEVCWWDGFDRVRAGSIVDYILTGKAYRLRGPGST